MFFSWYANQQTPTKLKMLHIHKHTNTHTHTVADQMSVFPPPSVRLSLLPGCNAKAGFVGLSSPSPPLSLGPRAEVASATSALKGKRQRLDLWERGDGWLRVCSVTNARWPFRDWLFIAFLFAFLRHSAMMREGTVVNGIPPSSSSLSSPPSPPSFSWFFLCLFFTLSKYTHDSYGEATRNTSSPPRSKRNIYIATMEHRFSHIARVMIATWDCL